MAWQITFATDDGEKVVDLDDLSPEVFERIAKETNAGLTYWGIYTFPKENPEILYKVICACAEHAGIDPPPKAETMRDAFAQDAQFSETPSIEEQPIENGFPQQPGATESGSSSGAPGSSDGTENSANDNP